MEPGFFQLGAAIRGLALLRTADVCPGSVPPPETRPASVWAREALGFQPSAKQAELLDLDGENLMLCCNRQWGKTTVIAIKALHYALSHAGRNIAVLAGSKQQAGLLVEYACGFAARLGLPIRRVFGNRASLKLPNGSRLCAVDPNTRNFVSEPADLLIVDEAGLVDDDALWTVSPTLCRTNGATWLLSTPRRQAGFFYNFWHDQDPRWRRFLSTVDDCPEFDRRYLDLLRMCNETRYRQEFLCEFIQPDNHLVSREFLQALLRPRPG